MDEGGLALLQEANDNRVRVPLSLLEMYTNKVSFCLNNSENKHGRCSEPIFPKFSDWIVPVGPSGKVIRHNKSLDTLVFRYLVIKPLMDPQSRNKVIPMAPEPHISPRLTPERVFFMELPKSSRESVLLLRLTA